MEQQPQTSDPKFRTWLRGLLKTENVQVVFTKTDGTERTMKCTLKSEVVVPYERKTEKQKTTNEDTLSVWDIDKNQWRSFRYDSIKSVSFGIGEGAI